MHRVAQVDAAESEVGSDLAIAQGSLPRFNSIRDVSQQQQQVHGKKLEEALAGCVEAASRYLRVRNWVADEDILKNVREMKESLSGNGIAVFATVYICDLRTRKPREAEANKLGKALRSLAAETDVVCFFPQERSKSNVSLAKARTLTAAVMWGKEHDHFLLRDIFIRRSELERRARESPVSFGALAMPAGDLALSA